MTFPNYAERLNLSLISNQVSVHTLLQSLKEIEVVEVFKSLFITNIFTTVAMRTNIEKLQNHKNYLL